MEKGCFDAILCLWLFGGAGLWQWASLGNTFGLSSYSCGGMWRKHEEGIAACSWLQLFFSLYWATESAALIQERGETCENVRVFLDVRKANWATRMEAISCHFIFVKHRQEFSQSWAKNAILLLLILFGWPPRGRRPSEARLADASWHHKKVNAWSAFES